MKRAMSSGHPVRRHPLAVAALLALGGSHAAFALPLGEQIVAGEVGVTRPAAGSMAIQQRSASGIVNWRGFSIDRGERVQIQQPHARSVLLNRVVGSDASRIFGQLSANGSVFLVNPNGVLFGAGAQVNVGSMVASTLELSDADFLAGRYRFAGQGGTVVNQGQINAAERGTVALLGGSVRNDGQIEARLGTVALAAGSAVTLDLAGDGLSRIVVTQAAIDAQVANGGALLADGGAVLLSAGALDAMLRDAVNSDGLVRARSLVEREGRIVLDGGERGTTMVSGTLDAGGTVAGTRGGEIQLLGRHVGVDGAARLDASGDAGGGRVLVGGDLRGANPAVRNAEASFVGPDATLSADAIDRGDGGHVVVWGNAAARAYGVMSARGGPRGGNGGTVETSGRYLDTSGARVDASAAAGQRGQWLLDPIDVTISNTPTGSVTPSPTFTAADNGANVNPADISAALNTGTSVTISSGDDSEVGESGHLSMADGVVIDKTAGGSATLRLNAHESIVVGDNTRIASSSGALDVEFNSDSDANGSGAIRIGSLSLRSNGGNVSLFGGSDLIGGRARGSAVPFGESSLPDAVSLLGTTIDTVPLAGGPGGAITMRGTGYSGAAGSAGDVGTPGTGSGAGGSGAAGDSGESGGSGVVLAGVNLIAGSGQINVDGIAGAGGAGGDGGIGGVGGSPVCTGEFCLSAPGGPGGSGGPGGTGGSGGTGIAINAGSTLSTTTGSLSLRGIGGIAGAGGEGNDGGAGGNALLGAVPDNGAVGGAGGNAGAGAAAGAAGAGILIVGGARLGVASGALAMNASAGSGAAGGAGALGGNGGSGAASTDGVDGAASSGGFASAGAPGLLFRSNTSGSTLQLAGGTIAIIASGGAGGVGSDELSAAVTATPGAGGGAGIAADGGITLDGTGSMSWLGTGGTGGVGGAAQAGELGGRGGDGGSGIEYVGVTQAGSVDFTLSGGGGAGGKGGDGGSGGTGGTGGAGFSAIGGAIRSTAGHLSVGGVGGAGGPRSLGSGASAPGTEGLNGEGVYLGRASDAEAVLGTGSGNIVVFGRASSSSDQRSATGLRLWFATVKSTAGGSIDLRGRSEAGGPGLPNAGTWSRNTDIYTSGGPGRILISGETTSGSYGVRIETSGDSGSAVGATSGDIVVRAMNDGSGDSIDLSAAVILTSGWVNLRPGGVSAAGGLTPADGVPISISNPVVVSEWEGRPPGFALSPNDLGSIQSGAAGVVIGSDTHTGEILVGLAYPWQDPLTLQNGGAGSQGIRIDSAIANPGRSVTLSSGGAVTQAPGASIGADSLLLHGTQATSTFVLNDPGNNVARLASHFEPTAAAAAAGSSVDYVNSAALTIGPQAPGGPPPAGSGFDAADNVPVQIVANDSSAASDFTARTLAGNLRLTQGIRTLGSDITLITPAVFDNAAGAPLAPGGSGRWTIWADTWDGETRGGLTPSAPYPNLYGCSYGAAACDSGAVLPAVGNHFVYVQRPALTVSADDQTRFYGSANPLLTETLNGLLGGNGDTRDDAFSGVLSTTATASSPVGDYPITAAPQTSAVGYLVTFDPGTLRVEPAPLTIRADDKSKVYGAQLPSLTRSVDGLVLGETEGVISGGQPSTSATASTGVAAGPVPIRLSAASAANYDVRLEEGRLTITPAPLTVAADNQQKLSGTPNPPLTAGFEGFVAGDTPATAEAAGMRLSTAAQALSPPGDYPIVVDPFVLSNYSIGYRPGTMRVWPSVQLENPTRAMGSQNSDVYGRNIGLPPMCFAGDARVAQDGPSAVDILSIEWSRVRQQPNVSNCIGIDQSHACDSF